MVVWKFDDSSTPLSTADITTTTTSSALRTRTDASSITFPTGFLTPSSGRNVDWVRRGVSWIVAVQNLEALRILLGCGYLAAGGLVVAGEAAKWTVRTAVLGAVGLGDVG